MRQNESVNSPTRSELHCQGFLINISHTNCKIHEVARHVNDTLSPLFLANTCNQNKMATDFIRISRLRICWSKSKTQSWGKRWDPQLTKTLRPSLEILPNAKSMTVRCQNHSFISIQDMKLQSISQTDDLSILKHILEVHPLSKPRQSLFD